MTTNIEHVEVEPLEVATFRDDERTRPAWTSRASGALALAVVAVLAVLGAALLAEDRTLGPGRVLCGVLVAAWAVCAVFVASRRPAEPLATLMAIVAIAGAAMLLGAAVHARPEATEHAQDVGAAMRALGVAILPAVVLHLALGLPDGVLRTRARRIIAAGAYAVAVALAVALVDERPRLRSWPIALEAGVFAVVAVVAYVGRYRSVVAARERARLLWVAWAIVVATAIAGGAWALHELVSWPEPVRVIAVASSALVPLALALGASERFGGRVDRLLVHTIATAGLAAMVAVVYLLVLLGLGREPSGDEQTLLGLSMLAAAVAALLWVPARERLTEFATRRVYGERHAPDEVLRTFGSRLTRALPLDELLLQLAESLKKTMVLEAAEVWLRTAGRLERAVSVPDRGPAEMALAPEEESVVARAGVAGAAWARIWMPAMVRGDHDILRIAPITNSGELLGLIVTRRADGAHHFEEDDDQALTDLARQVGLALHNVKLDSALQESLDEVRRQADELRASRARIVEAGDAQRRRIERDLHDGAQQHLVALAVNVNLARQIAAADPAAAQEILEQVAHDLQDAVQELRNLAHGIYPPLLMDRGLSEALRAAANRAALPTVVVADDIGRYPQAVEAAVYFCCLEALQNAGKHAGEGAHATVVIEVDEGALLFSVADDGAGFDLAGRGRDGHGFVNMSDRVGAIGGTVSVESAPGRGTRVAGRIPL